MSKINSKLHITNYKLIVEKELGIPADYQYKAIHSNNFFQANWHRNKMFVAEGLSRFNKNMSVLDLGTGSGNFELLFSKKVKSITGIDYNDEAVNFLISEVKARGIKNVNAIVSDIRDLKLPKGKKKFDLITLIDVIEHFHFRDLEIIFKNFKKYLKPGGKVLMITPNYKSSWPIIERLFDLFGLAPKFREHQHLSRLYRSNLEELTRMNGFTIDKVCTFNLFSYLIPNEWISKKLCLVETLIPFDLGNLIAVVFSNSSYK
jgi:2-polyprenyl-3-methyl-5-hydroxy-6-metoxy-1,4-benzoquinol methylase